MSEFGWEPLTEEELELVASELEKYPSGVPNGSWGSTPAFLRGDWEHKFSHFDSLSDMQGELEDLWDEPVFRAPGDVPMAELLEHG